MVIYSCEGRYRHFQFRSWKIRNTRFNNASGNVTTSFNTEKESVIAHGPPDLSMLEPRPYRFDRKSKGNYTMDREGSTILEAESSRAVQTRFSDDVSTDRQLSPPISNRYLHAMEDLIKHGIPRNRRLRKTRTHIHTFHRRIDNIWAEETVQIRRIETSSIGWKLYCWDISRHLPPVKTFCVSVRRMILPFLRRMGYL